MNICKTKIDQVYEGLVSFISFHYLFSYYAISFFTSSFDINYTCTNESIILYYQSELFDELGNIEKVLFPLNKNMHQNQT